MQWRVVVITGCDSGFGKQLACHLLEESYRGIHVIACCLTASGQSFFEKKSTEITKRDNGLTSLQLDVTSPFSIAQAKLEVERLIGALTKINSCDGLWAIVNNAGIAIPGAFELQSKEDMRRVLDVNFFGLANCCRAFLPLLRRQPGARIINVSSICGLVGLAGNTSYTASKYAVEGFSDSLRREIAPFGVQVVLIEPGFFHTNVTNIKHGAQNWLKQLQPQHEAVTAYGGVETVRKRMDDVHDLTQKICSSRTELVVHAMADAIVNRIPRIRYLVGADALCVWRPLSFLPGWLQDLVFTILNKIQNPTPLNTGRKRSGFRRRRCLAVVWVSVLLTAVASAKVGARDLKGMSLVASIVAFVVSCCVF